MSGTCINCNIQNSNPSYSSNNTAFSNLYIAPPKKRYNPADLLQPTISNSNQNESTSDVVNKNLNVSSQQAQGADSSSNARSGTLSNTSLLNQQTLLDVSQVVNVSSDIVAQEQQNKKITKTANTVYQGLETVDDKNKTVSRYLPIVGRNVKSSAQIVSEVEAKVNKGKKKSRKFPLTFGTLLASSPEFKREINLLTNIKPSTSSTSTKVNVPDSFDGREVWAQYLLPVRSQGLCGSCWAFTSSFVLSSRLAIYSNGQYKYDFSPAKLVFCNVTSATSKEIIFLSDLFSKKNLNFFDVSYETSEKGNAFGCEGQTLLGAFQFLFRYGVPEEKCLLYGDQNEDLEHDEVNLTIHDQIKRTCVSQFTTTYDQCLSSQDATKYHRIGGYYIVPGTPKQGGSEQNIREEIYRLGPVGSGIAITEDFLAWNGLGIYTIPAQDSDVLGGHAVAIVGFGIEGTTPYWIIRNSWSKDWGDQGYFKLLRGSNLLGIEENVLTAIPDIPSVKSSVKYPLLVDDHDYMFRYLWNLNQTGYKVTTLEKIVSGTQSNVNVDVSKPLYDVQVFPSDFRTFIAAKMTASTVEPFINEISAQIKNIKYNPQLQVIIIIVLLILLYKL